MLPESPTRNIKNTIKTNTWIAQYTQHLDCTLSTHQLDKFHDERFCDQIFCCKSHICSFRRFPPSEKAFTPVVNAMFSAPYLLKCLFIRAGDKDRNVSAHYFLLYQFHEQSKLGRSSSWAINYREPEEAERVEIAEHNCPQAPPEKAINFFPCG